MCPYQMQEKRAESLLTQTFSCSIATHVSKLNENIEEASDRQIFATQTLGCAVILFHTPTKRCRMKNIKQAFF